MFLNRISLQDLPIPHIIVNPLGVLKPLHLQRMKDGLDVQPILKVDLFSIEIVLVPFKIPGPLSILPERLVKIRVIPNAPFEFARHGHHVRLAEAPSASDMNRQTLTPHHNTHIHFLS